MELFTDPSRPERGVGVRVSCAVAKGAVLCEYRGDWLTAEQAEQRELRYEAQHGCYMFYVTYRGAVYCLDATILPDETDTLSLGCGRYLNHSRKRPNVLARLQADSELGRPRLLFYARRKIRAGEELLIDYGDRDRASIEAHPWLRD
jgi:histone-lysine N-methyltransferase SETD8